MKYQLEVEERYKQYEDERWQKEVELEEKRRQEDQQHEIRLMGMMASMFQRSHHNYSFNYEDTDYPTDY